MGSVTPDGWSSNLAEELAPDQKQEGRGRTHHEMIRLSSISMLGRRSRCKKSLGVNELAVFKELKEDWCGWGLEREADGFGGEVKGVGRKGPVGPGGVCILFLRVMGSQWEALSRGVT